MSRQDTRLKAGQAGHRNPPSSNRFRPGQSGNLKGRPKGSRREPPYESVLGQMVTIRDDGIERRITAAEAFLLRLTKLGLEGDNAAARAAIQAIEELKDNRVLGRTEDVTINWQIVSPGSVNNALELLRMARLHDKYSETNATILLEPWIVEAALGRLAVRRLSVEEQRIVRKATRTPHKVRWPEWWTEFS